MNKTLLIVESPAKAKTIARYLGKDFQVAASVGHVRDLPASTLGVDVNNNFKPRYITMPGKEAVIRDLKKKNEQADRVLLATDPDREGEAIAWHLAHLLKIDPNSNCRVSFNEITAKAIKVAVNEARPIDLDLVDAQQARRVLDRLVGYELSPLLWRKIQKGLSAGRVQSLATRLIVQREREISAFVPEEYWLVTAFLQTATQEKFKARYHGMSKAGKIKAQKLGKLEDCVALKQRIAGQEFTVLKLKKADSLRHSFPPFTTSSLQQEASRILNYSSQRTMRLAQQLYEGVNLSDAGPTALVTYIRTDSVRISQDAVSEAREYIFQTHGSPYLPEKARFFKNKKAAQDAHEAIRPVHFDLPPEQIKEQLSSEQYKLYKLIWDKFIASQMNAAVFATVSADLACLDYVFRVKGETLQFPGWLKQYGRDVEQEQSEENDSGDELKKEKLPELCEGQLLTLLKLTEEQKFTQPPARYTEASLIKLLEEEGIGRPSTYAPIISTIVNRNYVAKDKRYLLPTALGEQVTLLLEENFPQIVDTEFTARMEEDLDIVEAGQRAWLEVLATFYPTFHQQVETANETVAKIQQPVISTGEACPSCAQGELLIKTGRYGNFIACSNYPDCSFTKAIEETAPGQCPLCGSGLLKKSSKKRKNSVFYVCDQKGKDDKCTFISWDLPLAEQCEVCGSYKVQKRFRGKNYTRCSNKDCPSNKTKKS